MKRKTINLEKFLELYTPFSEIGGWCSEKHERKHDLYDYFRKIDSISIQSKKDGLAALIEGNNSFTVFRVPRLQRGKMFSLRGKWVLMSGAGGFRGGKCLEVFKLRSKPSDELFHKMSKLYGYCQNEDYYEELEEYYSQIEIERSKKDRKKPRIYILAFISQYSPIKATCTECNLATTFSGYWSYRTKERHHNVDEYQCQSCGALSFSEEEQKGIAVACIDPCKCGGQRRRDKNIFCPGCGYRKRKNNRAESFTAISQVELDILEKRHESILEND